MKAAFLTKVLFGFSTIEFRAQIEKIMADVEIDHINSHVHTHAIPAIFNLVLKLSLEYKIKNVRLQYEKPYFVPKISKTINCKYPINLIKLGLLNNLSKTNKLTVQNLNSKSEKININDYLIGVNFTGNMDKDTILYGLRALQDTEGDTVTEILVHPKYLTCDEFKTNYKELLAVAEPELKTEIQNLGFNLTNYRELNSKTLAAV